MTEKLFSDEMLRRNSARKAIQQEARARLEERANAKSGLVGDVALYIWGALALLSAGLATSVGLQGTEFEQSYAWLFNTKEQSQVAEAQPKPKTAPPVETAGTSIEELKQAEVVPQKVQDALAAASPDLDPVATASIPETEASASLVVDQVVERVSNAPLETRYGVEIGNSASVPALTNRFKALQRREPTLFEDIVPLMQFSSGDGPLTVQLIAGPFADEKMAASFCRSVRLRLTIECEQTGYKGDPLSATR